MARNRMIKPSFWDDEKLGCESESVQLTYVGTWTFSDDYGVVRANASWLKNKIYPYKQTLRIDVFSKWLEVLEGHEMLIPFTVRGEKYYFIRTFRLHQSVEKPSKTRNCSEEELRNALKTIGFHESEDGGWHKVVNHSDNSRVVVAAEEKRSISVSEENGIATAIPAAPRAQLLKFTSKDAELERVFKALKIPTDNKEAWSFVKDWIEANKPQFIEPYAVMWNIFVSFYAFPCVTKVNSNRRRKFATRIKEDTFDFFAILNQAKKSEFLKNSKFFTFDWIIENETNYLKVIEGHYK